MKLNEEKDPSELLNLCMSGHTRRPHEERKKIVPALTSGGREVAIGETCLYRTPRGTACGNSVGTTDSKASVEKKICRGKNRYSQ